MGSLCRFANAVDGVNCLQIGKTWHFTIKNPRNVFPTRQNRAYTKIVGGSGSAADPADDAPRHSLVGLFVPTQRWIQIDDRALLDAERAATAAAVAIQSSRLWRTVTLVQAALSNETYDTRDWQPCEISS